MSMVLENCLCLLVEILVTYIDTLISGPSKICVISCIIIIIISDCF